MMTDRLVGVSLVRLANAAAHFQVLLSITLSVVVGNLKSGFTQITSQL